MAHLLPHPSGVIPTAVDLEEVLGFRYHTCRDRAGQESQEVLTIGDEEDPENPQQIIDSTPEEVVEHKTDSKKDPLSEPDM